MIGIRKTGLSMIQRTRTGGGTLLWQWRPASSLSSSPLRAYSSARPRPRPRQAGPKRRTIRTATISGTQNVGSTTTNANSEYPTPTMVATMPTDYREMDNTALTTLGAMANHAALEEMLKRHIMKTDQVTYEEAADIFLTIEQKNHQSEQAMAIPFQLGIVACFGAFAVAVPMVFHLPTVEYFNEHFVTAEHPPTKELETALEVGAWSWNWMEPVMGTSTFLLLSLQYMRCVCFYG